jgi:energy-coupling factor transport system substrate-specific component
MKRIVSNLVVGVLVIACIMIGVVSFRDRRYNMVSILIALLACIPFYFAYEKRRGNIRRMVILSTLIALSVIGRILVFVPGFKPVTAIVILAGMYMGAEAGFLCGSLSAILSNMFFGQGPWTPFQMLAWGSAGFIAGIPFVRKLLQNRIALSIYGGMTGIFYSFIMDIWTVLSFDGIFSISRYIVAITAAIPVTVEYAVSNVIFLWILRKPIGEKLQRIKVKHGIF